MTTSGAGIFYNGRCSDGHNVTVEVDGGSIRLRWPGSANNVHRVRRPDRLRPVATPGDVLRLAFGGAKTQARLEVKDAALQEALLRGLKLNDRSGLNSFWTRCNVVAGS